MIAFILRCKQIADKYCKDEMTVYAAQASFFIVLSAFPTIMLIMTLVQIVPNLSQSNIMSFVLSVVPNMFHSMVISIIDDLYTKSPTTILSITVITALWSASKGMLGIERGLNRVQADVSTRGYILSRIICAGYTILFILVCGLSQIVLVFGQAFQKLVSRYFPFLTGIAESIIDMRTMFSLVILFVFFLGIYDVLPYRKLSIRSQIPGAIFSTIGWMGFSYLFALYINNFGNFSYMYGSLTVIVLMMLWLYFCICILFLGAELNWFLEKFGMFFWKR